MSIFKEVEMTDDEHKEIVIRIGSAFKELPSNQSRFEILASLAGIMMTDGAAGPGPSKGWLDTAQASLEGCARFCNMGKEESSE